MTFLFRLLISLVPFWPLKRIILCFFYGYKIHPTARIGYSYVFPRNLCMNAYSSIGHGTVCKGLSTLWMGPYAHIGQLNWITGFPKPSTSRHFSSQLKRNPSLVIGKHAAITNRHLLDCTDRIVVGPYTTIAGFGSQLLTHSIDITVSRQVAKPIFIGQHCFIGTRVTVLPQSHIPPFVVIGAGAVVSGKLEKPYFLYGGVPARPLKPLSLLALYFKRTEGYVY